MVRLFVILLLEAAKVASTDDGRVFVEIRPDIYPKHKSLKRKVMKVLEARGLSRRVDWAKLDASIKNMTGMIEDVSAMRQSVENITVIRPM